MSLESHSTVTTRDGLISSVPVGQGRGMDLFHVRSHHTTYKCSHSRVLMSIFEFNLYFVISKRAKE